MIISPNIADLEKYAHDTAEKYGAGDVFWLRPLDEAKSIGVKETVEFMNMAFLAPIGLAKLMIIIDASTLTPQAQNKMLKTIEDAPGETNFLLLATNVETVLNTIKSRCVTNYLPVVQVDTPLLPPATVDVLRKVFGIEFDEKTLNARQRLGILDALAKTKRNIGANCNAANHGDLVIMEILKNAKNG